MVRPGGYCLFVVICLLMVGTHSVFGQQPLVRYEIKDGKVTDKTTHPQTARNKFAFLVPQPSPAHNNTQRTTSGNAIAITVSTTGATCGYANGSIIAEASGGTAPYTFQLSNGAPEQRNGSFYYIPGGNYMVTVTDALGQVATAPATVSNTNSPPVLGVSAHTPASGCATDDASVTLSVTGGTPPYEYSIDMVNYQASNTFSNLSPGMYVFSVRDANGCMAWYDAYNLSFLISPSCSTPMGISYTPYSCTNEGLINMNNMGPNPPYTYSLDGVNFQSSGNFTGLTSGFYTVYTKSAGGLIQKLVVPIFQSCTIKIDFIQIAAACQQNDGALTVNASLGATPYTYSIDGINFQTSNTFTNLAPGLYFVAVRDNNGVMAFATGTVYDKCPELWTVITNETCAKNDGAITANAAKGTAPYTYSLDGINYQTNNVFTGLAAGNYTVYLKDALGFTATSLITVVYDCIEVSATYINETCGSQNGSITAQAKTGQSPFEYSINGTNFQLSGVFTGLAAGTYTITVRDASGQTGTVTVTLTNTPGATITTTSTPTICNQADGTITITASGGTPPYTYHVDGVNQASNVFTGLSGGVHTVFVKDANGCITENNTPVLNRCLGVNASIVAQETCFGSNGIISVIGVDGTAPYQYSIDGINFQTGTQFTGLKAGNYTITVKDAWGYTATNTLAVINICPMVNPTVTDGKCTTNGGSIVATATNGTAPYEYSINGVDFQTDNTFSNLTTGNYTITVRDAGGLTNTTTAQVNNFPSPVLSAGSTAATCSGNDGTISLIANGGSSAFTYSINGNPYQPAAEFYNLPAGNYTATVKDANGCTATAPVVIALINNLTLTMGNDITVCEGDKGILPAATNGAQFSWAPATGLNNASLLNPEVSAFTTTTYTLTSKLGACSLSGSVTVNVNAAPVADAGEGSTICFGSDILLSGNGGIAYQWSPATYLNNPQLQQPLVKKPQSSITYSLVVTDANGCHSLNEETVTITVTAPSKLFAGNDTAIMMGQPFQLLAQDINNSGFVNYSWSPAYGLNNAAIANPVTILDQPIQYTVTASTAAGCEGKDDINIKVFRGPDIYVPNAFTPNNNNNKNDIFKPILVGIKKLNHFAVYNRWGQRIFYTNEPNKGWDGTVTGKHQSENMYIWMVEGVDVNDKVIRKKGTVLLIQ